MIVLKDILRLFLIYIIIGNSLGFIVVMIEYVYHKTSPNVKSYKSFALNAMYGSPDHFARFKETPDYNRLMNTSSADSVRHYWNKYKHSE